MRAFALDLLPLPHPPHFRKVLVIVQDTLYSCSPCPSLSFAVQQNSQNIRTVPPTTQMVPGLFIDPPEKLPSRQSKSHRRPRAFARVWGGDPLGSVARSLYLKECPCAPARIAPLGHTITGHLPGR